MSTVKVEKIGGLAGFGLPGSKLKSSGETAISALSPADQAWVEAVFQKPRGSQEAGNERDAHCYRITRTKTGATRPLKFLKQRCLTPSRRASPTNCVDPDRRGHRFHLRPHSSQLLSNFRAVPKLPR